LTNEQLNQFTAVASNDPVKRDLELTCIVCKERLCDVEDGDTLSCLVMMAEEHVCDPTAIENAEE